MNLKKLFFIIPYLISIIFFLTFGITYKMNLINNINTKFDIIILLFLIIIFLLSAILMFIEVICSAIKLCKSKNPNKQYYLFLLIFFNIFINPYINFVILQNKNEYKKLCKLYFCISFISFIIFYCCVNF